MEEYKCSRESCGKLFLRYPSQVSKSGVIYCGRACKGLDMSEKRVGAGNPNYRTGAWTQTPCQCGHPKDIRALQCAHCAGRSYGIGKKYEDKFVVGERRREIRYHVLKNKSIPYVCECGQEPSWQGKELVLQLDHINGNPADNRLENLRFLCPNCHTQTDTFGSKNKKERAL